MSKEKRSSGSILSKLAAISGVLGFAYGLATYAPWFIASRHAWYDKNAGNGCLRISFSVPYIRLDTYSPIDSMHGVVQTTFSNGFPVFLWINNARFKIPKFNQAGTAEIRLGFDRIATLSVYDTEGSHPPHNTNPNPNYYERVESCPN